MATAQVYKTLVLKLNTKELNDLNDYLDTDGLIEDGDELEIYQFDKKDFEILFNLNLDEYDIDYSEIDKLIVVETC